MTLDDAITEIARARKRLADDQGRLARKNARAAVQAKRMIVDGSVS